ncbi:putative P-type Ca(2+) transporter [Helianthus annuus]|nr:putative P-type Ca(2+) transporter [Helianthus annuus]
MDTLGALARATEPPTDHLMDHLPVGCREPLITNIMWRNLLIQLVAVSDSCCCCCCFFCLFCSV